MKYLIPILVGGATIIVAVTTALAQAHGAFSGRVPLTPYLYGYGAALLLLVIAVVMAVQAAKQEKIPPAPLGGQTIKQEANPQQHVYIGKEFLPQPREDRKPEPISLPEPPRPNIKCLPIRRTLVTMIHNVPTHVCSFREHADGELVSILACFRNEAIFEKHIKPIHRARAHLKLFDNAGAEIGHGVSRAAWLGHADDLVNLIPGEEAQCVILLLQDDGKLTVPSKRRASSGQYDTISDRFMDVEQPPSAIEISLLDSDDQLVIPPVLAELAGEGNELLYKIKQ